MISIVIPAHNEEQVIGRCLRSILAGADPGEFEIVVVTNGCTDRTAEVARSFGPGVTVVDSPIASKPAALNLGDATARGFPRMYIDADIEVDAAAIRAVGTVLDDGAKLAAPMIVHDLSSRPWPVRAYLDIWAQLPYASDNHVGSGFYGLSAEARALFGDFPDTMAEDFFIRSLAPAGERVAVDGHAFVIHPPYTLRSLTKIRARMFAANAANRNLFASDAKDVLHGHLSGLLGLARQPRNWPGLALYVGVVAVAKSMAARKNRSATAGVWERDTTARTAASAGHR